MANTKQSTKRAQQAEKRRANNHPQRTRIRTAIKRVLSAVLTRNYELAMNGYREMTSIVDRAAGKGLIHKNKAARHKSRLNAQVKALAPTPLSACTLPESAA